MTLPLPLPPRFPKRLVYLGTPEMAVPPLQALLDAGFDVPLVISRADKRRGRRSGQQPSPVKAAARAAGVTVSDDLDACGDVGADLGVVVAYGRLISRAVLETLPMVNIHFSLLPRWRGAAPVERAILAGDSETGVCLMAVAEALDAGDVYGRRTVPIGPATTADELRAELVTAGAELLVSSLTAGLGEPEPQVGEPTYAAKIDPGELRLDFRRSAVELHRLVRIGRAWCEFRGKRLKVLDALGESASADAPPGTLAGSEVVTGEGRLRLVTVQPEGKRPMPAKGWLNGLHLEPGERLG